VFFPPEECRKLSPTTKNSTNSGCPTESRHRTRHKPVGPCIHCHYQCIGPSDNLEDLTWVLDSTYRLHIPRAVLLLQAPKAKDSRGLLTYLRASSNDPYLTAVECILT
jgi:hypothetical protein